MAAEPRYCQIPEAELVPMNSLVAVVMSEERTASLTVALAAVELLEPMVLDGVTGPDFALEPKNLQVGGCALEAAGPMVVGAESEEALVPMDWHWLLSGLGLVLIASKVAEFELELEAMMVAVAELEPKVVGAELVLEPAATLVGMPCVVAVAESMAAAVGVPFEPAEPKEVVLEVWAGVVASMEVDGVIVTVMAVPMALGAALVGLAVDPKVAAFAAHSVILDCVPRWAGPVFALEADSREVDFAKSRYL